MKRSWAVGLALCAAGLSVYLAFNPGRLSTKPATESSSEQSPHSNPDAHRSISPQSRNTSASTEPAADASLLSSAPPGTSSPAPAESATSASSSPAPTPSATSSELPPATVLEQVRRIVTQYNVMFGENPVGTNEEITKALQGDNPKQIDFLTAETNRISAHGELVDPWGTPLFFHQLSAKDMEIRSAGPDKIMWTSDDLVTR